MNSADKKEHSKEILFILECLQSLIQNRAPEIDSRRITGLDWNQLLRLAREQRVLGLFGHVLEKGGAFPLVPVTVKEEIEKGVHEYNQGLLIKKWQFGSIHRLCREQNLEIIPYKGAALALTVFKDLPFRRMSDIDIFIRESDAARIYPLFFKQGFARLETPYPNRWQAEILRGAYAAPSGRESLFKQGWDIDIHRQARYHIEKDIVSLDMQDVWSRAKPRATELGEVLFLDDIDHTLLLLFHAIDLFAPHFSQIVDTALLMKSSAIRKEDLIARLPGNLGPEASAFLETASDAIEEFLAPQKRSGNFSEATIRFFDLFFYKRKRTYEEPLSSSGWKRLAKSLKAIRSVREKVVFIAGFFVPDPEYYKKQGKSGLSSYLHHWGQLSSRILKSFN